MSAAAVLVTGGTGLVGAEVVRNLLAHGHRVTVLTADPDHDPDGVRTVHGDVREAELVARAVDGIDAVVHLAAIPSPWNDPAAVVFANNAVATFTVLWTAAERGIRRFVIASSVNATGLLMNPHRPLPDRYPIDEATVHDVADPYSLSKQADEATLAAVCRRFGASGVALRLPLMVAPERAGELAQWQADRAAEGAGDGWGWLDTRDGAEAFRLAVTAGYQGAHVVHVAAATTSQDVPTEDLLDRYAPDVPRDGAWPGRLAPIDTTRARLLLGFTPRRSAFGEEG